MIRTLRLMWRLALSRPLFYAAHAAAFAAHQFATLAPGLVVKAIYDSLALSQVGNHGVPVLIALLVGVAAGRAES